MTDEPQPSKSDRTKCGQPMSNMTEIDKREVRKAQHYEFCRKCSQLLNLA